MRVVQFSTGLASAEVARREVEAHSAAKVLLLTADTRVEDPDNWRFAHEVVDSLGPVRWEILADGRTPMQVGRDARCVPSDRMDVCSRVLKRELLRRWINEHCDPADDTIVLGFDWTEEHRLAKAAPRWAPFTVEAPLCDPPLVDKADLLDQWRARGIEPPRLYARGFQHANCYGACVRAGQAAWALLWETNPDVYLRWEDDEEATRVQLNCWVWPDDLPGYPNPPGGVSREEHKYLIRGAHQVVDLFADEELVDALWQDEAKRRELTRREPSDG